MHEVSCAERQVSSIDAVHDEGLGLQPMRGPATQSDYVYEALRQAIIEGRLKRGVLYPVASLAAEFDLSRTPVREALLQLARDGMVKLERSRGVRILEPPDRDVRDMFVLRQLLEPWAAGQAVVATREPALRERLVAELREAFHGLHEAAAANDEQRFWRFDRAFHYAILQATGNRRVAKTVDGLRDIMLMHQATTAALRAPTMVDVAEDHRPILEAIERGDADRAYRTMRDHVMHASERVLAHQRRAWGVFMSAVQRAAGLEYA